jgi:hypothetical protein
MSKFEDRQAVASKIGWEGGIWEALEYGIKTEDMPEGDTELAEKWEALRTAFASAEAAWNAVSALLPEGEGE